MKDMDLFYTPSIVVSWCSARISCVLRHLDRFFTEYHHLPIRSKSTSMIHDHIFCFIDMYT